MDTPSQADSGIGFRVTIGAAGRMVMPAEIRKRHNIRPGDTLVVRSQGNAVEVKTREQVLSDAQDYVCSLLPPGRSLVDELIEERRREAQAE